MSRAHEAGPQHIREALYKKIYAAVPIFCVDVVAEDPKGNFLIVRRRNEPARGKWWVPGGRVLKNEPLRRAAVRKLKEETGIAGRFERTIGLYEFFAQRGPFVGIRAHTPIAVCLVCIAGKGRVRLDRQSGEFRWVMAPVRGMHRDLAGIIRRRHRKAETWNVKKVSNPKSE